MHLGEKNQSIGVLIMYDKIIGIKDQKLCGIVGKLYDDLLIKPEKRKSRYVTELIFGEREKNSNNYTGMLGLLQRNLVSIYLRAFIPFYDTDFIEMDVPLITEEFLIVEQLNSDEYNKEYNNILDSLNFDRTFFSIFLMAFIMIAFTVKVIELLKMKENHMIRPLLRKRPLFIRKEKRINVAGQLRRMLSILFGHFLNVRLCLAYSLSALGFLLMFYDFHLFFTRLFIMNSIKTNKVVLDTSKIIKDERDIFATKKLACFVDGDLETIIASNAPSTNILKRIINQKTQFKSNDEEKKRCIFKSTDFNVNMDTKDRFTVMSKHTIIPALVLMNDFRTNNLVWLNSKPVYDCNLYLYINKMDPDLQYLRRINMAYLEIGLPIRMSNRLQSLKHVSFKSSNFIYSTIEEYVNDFTKFDVLTIHNYRLLFMIYLIFCLSIIFIRLCAFAVSDLIVRLQ